MADETTVSEETQAPEGQATEATEAPEGQAESQSEEAEVTEQSEDNSEFSKINPDELPKELQEVYKNMQRAFHADKQASAELRKKAEMYDQYLQEQMLKEKFPESVSRSTVSDETSDYIAEALGVDPSQLDAEQKSQYQQLIKVVEAVANRRIQEQITPLQQNLVTRDLKQELQEVRKKYPDFDQYAQEIVKITSKNKNMSYEEAYKIVSYEDRAKKGRLEAIENLKVKKKQSTPKTTASSSSDEPEGKGFDAIFKWALNKTGN